MTPLVSFRDCPVVFFIITAGALLLELITSKSKNKINAYSLLFAGAFTAVFFFRNAGMLLGGIVLLIRAADILILGAKSIAERAGIPPLLIGIVIIGFGTSMPELFVNVLSAVRQDTALAFGNITGSNIANMGLVIGLAGIIAGKISIQKSIITAEIPVMLGCVLLFTILLLDFPPFLTGGSFSRGGVLTSQDGLVFLLCLCMYFLYLMHSISGKKSSAIPVIKPEQKIKAGDSSIITALLLTGGGVCGLYFGGNFVVTAAVSLAEMLGAGTLVLGVIVGVGTSLPELAAALSCAGKGEADLVVGNVVGSNIFNILLILGITALIHPVAVSSGEFIHILFLGVSSFFFFLTLGTKRNLNRTEAFFLFFMGAGYLGYTVSKI